MVISGHVHQSPFIPDGSWFDRLGTTWVFNTGLQHGRPPVCIVLDLDEGAAFWLAAGEAQCIDLRAPLLRPAAPIENPPPWLISFGSDCRSEFASFGEPRGWLMANDDKTREEMAGGAGQWFFSNQ
jgi:hypothetical protein